MKCIQEGCEDRAIAGWLKCHPHIWAEEKKTMTTEPELEPCAITRCEGKRKANGCILCEKHRDDWMRSDIGSAYAWAAEMNRITPKQNEGKRRFSLVRRKFIRAIADVMTWGSGKYPAENYLSLDSTTIYDSMMRHLDDHLSGKKIDEESGKPHLHHFASNAMMWFMLELRKDEGK